MPKYVPLPLGEMMHGVLDAISREHSDVFLYLGRTLHVCPDVSELVREQHVGTCKNAIHEVQGYYHSKSCCRRAKSQISTLTGKEKIFDAFQRLNTYTHLMQHHHPDLLKGIDRQWRPMFQDQLRI